MLDLRNTDAADALEAARAGFVAARPKTVAMREEATAVMPGGNTRTVLYHGPVPLRFQKIQHRRETHIGAFHQLAPLRLGFGFKHGGQFYF